MPPLLPNLDALLRAIDRLAWAVRKRGVFGAVWRLIGPVRPLSEAEAYARWQKRVERRRRRRNASGDPVVEFVIPSAQAGPDALRRTIDSLRAQRHPWSAVVPLEGAADDVVAAARACASKDPRIRVLPDAGPDAALDTRAPVIATATPGVVVAPHASDAIAAAWNARPAPDLVYADEDRLDGDGVRYAPYFKPGFSPDLLRATAYFGRLLAFAPDLARRAGGLGAATPHDLALRLSERATHVVHLADVLHHVPLELGTALPTEPSAVRAALARAGEDADVVPLGQGRLRLRYAIRGEPLVSVIIPTRDRAALLSRALDAVRIFGGWPRFELLVVDNGSVEPDTARLLSSLQAPHRVLSRPGPFDFAALNNDAAREARGEFLLFLNNDVEGIEPGWIPALLEHAQRPEVGAVGAKLLFPDRTIQHAGVALGMGGFAGHPFQGLAADERVPGGMLGVVRNCSAVTGACLMMRRELFRSLGGFDAALRIAFNDVDLCLRAAVRGHRTLWTPHACLTHHESASRVARDPREDYLLVRRRWRRLALSGDPFFRTWPS